MSAAVPDIDLDRARIAIVHDYLIELGGAERVVATMREVFPSADVYTSVHLPERTAEMFPAGSVRTTWMQRLVRSKPQAMALAPLIPLAFRSLDLRGYDVVISSSSGFAHHVRTPGAFHLCYCYTPPRFLWQPEVYFASRPWAGRAAWPLLQALRIADRRASRGPDAYAGISRLVAERIRATYGRDAEVIYPPTDIRRFQPSEVRSGRFLVVSRLQDYKRIDIPVEAATMIGAPLDVIGDGPERARLQALAGPTVRFLGRVPDAQVVTLMAEAEAVILPGSEDYGLTPVEAQASGRPPIAFASGGALETIEDGVTGFHFPAQTPAALVAAMRRAQSTPLDPARLRAAAEALSVPAFAERLRASVRTGLQAARTRPHG